MSAKEHSLHRDMSYRKPVPKFIPSPPPSPPSSPGSPFRRLSLTLASAMNNNNDLPPLPADWRDAIDRAVSGRRTPNCHTSQSTCPDTPNINTLVIANDEGKEHYSPTVTLSELETSGSMTLAPSSDYGDYDPASRPESPTPWSTIPRTTTKRKQHADYRPPTPPLPAQRRSRSSNAASFETGTSPEPSMISHLAPRDRSFVESSHHRRPSSQSPPTPPAGSSIHDGPILVFQTEKNESISPELSSTWSSTCTPALPSHPLPPSGLNLDDKWHEGKVPPSSSNVVTPQYHHHDEPKMLPRVKVDAELPPLPGFRNAARRLLGSFGAWLRRTGFALGSAFCL